MNNSGRIGGALSVVKVGSGTATFSTTNTYGGNTTISGGTLALSGSGVIASSPTISIAAGTTLSASTPIYDMVRQVIHKREVPADAVVIQGSRPLKKAAGICEGLHLSCPVIIKYRDNKTDSALQLEDFLR